MKNKLQQFLLVLFGLSTSFSFAEQIHVLEEIVVTARKQQENLMQVPLSVNVVSGQKLDDININGLQDLSPYVPNFSRIQTAVGTIITVRGISSGTNQGFEQSVGTFIDGIYMGRQEQSAIPFLDVERIEVLRGPQAVLFGKNTVAGAINITSARPTAEQEGYASVLYEPRFRGQEYTGAISGAVNDEVRARLALRRSSTDGFSFNETLDRDESFGRSSSIRLSFDADINDDLSAYFKLDRHDIASTGSAAEVFYAPGATPPAQFTGIEGQLNYRRSGTNVPMFDDNSNDFVLDTAALHLVSSWNDLTLTHILGYSTFRSLNSTDLDASPSALFHFVSDGDQSQYSYEFRINSPAGERVEYTAGLYVQRSQYDRDLVVSFNQLPAPARANRISVQDQETDTWSLFGQLTFNLSEVTRLTGGLRYTYEEKDLVHSVSVRQFDGSPPTGFMLAVFASPAVNTVPFSDTPFGRDRGRLMPMLSVEHDVDPNTLIYATYSKAYKSGGFNFNNSNPADFDTIEFSDEEADSIDLGAKMDLLGGAANVNVALFYNEFQDMQVSTFDGISAFNVTNAAEAKSHGVEIDGRWRVTEGFTLSAAIAYLDFEFVEFLGQCTAAQTVAVAPAVCVQDYAGRPNTYSPKYSGFVGGEQIVPLHNGLMMQGVVDLTFTDDFFCNR